MTHTTSSILVLGAGELGLAVLRGLARQREQHPDTLLTVLLRPATINSDDLAKRRDLDTLRALQVEVLPGDLAAASAAQLSDLFRPFETIISCTGFVGGSGTQRKLTQAALGASVRRYIPWQFGVDYDTIGRGRAQELFDEQLDVRDLLRGQNRTEWIIISTGMFTSFLFEPSFGVVDLAENTMHALGSFENAVTVTTAEDIGTLTAEIVFAEPRIVNQVVYTAGDTVTYARLADIINSVTGTKIRRAEWSIAELKDELAQDPDDALKKYRVVFAEGRGVAWDRADTFNARHGIKTENVESWLRASLNSGR